MNAQYRIVTNGKHFSIEKLVHRKFLWWKWQEWWGYGHQSDRWLGASWWDFEKRPILMKKFNTMDEAQHEIDQLIEIERQEAQGFQPV